MSRGRSGDLGWANFEALKPINNFGFWIWDFGSRSRARSVEFLDAHVSSAEQAYQFRHDAIWNETAKLSDIGGFRGGTFERGFHENEPSCSDSLRYFKYIY